MITKQELLQEINSNFSFPKKRPVYRSFFKIDGKVFLIKSKSEKLLLKLTKALMHLKVEENSLPVASLTIEIWSGHDKLFSKLHSGDKSLVRLQSESNLFFYTPGTGKASSFSYYDLDANRAVYCVEDENNIPWYEFAAPFRTIFHWFFIRNGYELIHGASVANANRGVLFLGKSGRGKTSTSLTALLASDLYFLGDDYVLLNKSASEVFCLYSSAKMDNTSLVRFKGALNLNGFSKPKDNEKHIIFLFERFRYKVQKSAPICAVALPEVDTKNKTSSWEKVSPSRVLLEVASSTIFQSLPQDRKYSFKLLAGCINRCKQYKFRVSTDPVEIGLSIKKQLSKLQ